MLSNPMTFNFCCWDCLSIPAVAVGSAPCGCWATRAAAAVASALAAVELPPCCVASMASRDCRSTQLRYQVMFVFSCATIHACSTRSDRSRSQVHCHKECCIVQQGMWEVSSVCRGWSVDVLCQQCRMEGKLGDVRVGCGVARSQRPAAVMAMAVAVDGNKE